MISPRFHDSAENPGVLIASPNAFFRRQIIDTLPPGWRTVIEAGGGAEALGKLESSDCRMLVLDRELPDLDVEELAGIVRLRYPGVDIRTVESPSVKTGMIVRPEFPSGLDRSAPAANADRLGGIVGTSERMRSVYRAIRRVAPRDTSVLIMGETGTGKELVAKAIHRASRRSEKPMVVINCAAIPESLLESELFGYVRGAFTGAAQTKLGRIQAANGGTLFLDEIGDMPFELQAKLLRFLESGELQRLGSSENWRVDVRVLAATNRNLRESVQSQRFRADLFYRLCVFPIVLPALRERTGDIAELANNFLAGYDGASYFTPAALKKLEEHHWPGNVRELKHVIERATILADDKAIGVADLVLDAETGTN